MNIECSEDELGLIVWALGFTGCQDKEIHQKLSVIQDDLLFLHNKPHFNLERIKYGR